MANQNNQCSARGEDAGSEEKASVIF
jgi:hypothetical protein